MLAFPLPTLLLFRKALFLATTLPKIVKNSIFLLKFNRNFSKFSQKFHSICVCRPNVRKFSSGFVKFCVKLATIMHFCNFLKKNFAKFRKFPARGALPPDPHEADPLTCSPPEMKSWLPPAYEHNCVLLGEGIDSFWNLEKLFYFPSSIYGEPCIRFLNFLERFKVYVSSAKMKLFKVLKELCQV